jgi:hypothetical protein
METKICTKCNVEYPKTNEFFHFVSNSIIKFRANCKNCTRNNGNKYYKLNSEICLEKIKKYRQTEKGKKVDIKSTLKWREKNKEKWSNYSKEYSIKNRIKKSKNHKILSKKHRLELNDNYIKQLLYLTCIHNDMKSSKIPINILETKRQSIILKRKLKNHEQPQICN